MSCELHFPVQVGKTLLKMGDYLTIDLDGTNLRISRVTLEGGGQYELTHTCSGIPEEAKKE